MTKQSQLDSISKSGNSFGALLFGKYEKLLPTDFRELSLVICPV